MSKLKRALKEAYWGYKANKAVRQSAKPTPDEHAQHPIALVCALLCTFLIIYLWGLTGVVVGIVVVLILNYFLSKRFPD